jgi:hypothetical protein
MTQALFDITKIVSRSSATTGLSACRKGELAETLFIAGAMVHDWEIFTPFGHGQAADVVLTRSGVRPLGVQVKTGTLVNASTYSFTAKRGTASRRIARPYEQYDFDVLAAYLPDRNQFVFWTFDDIRGRVTVRYNPNKHRQPGNWDLLDNVAESLTASKPTPTDVLPPTVQMTSIP